MLLFLCSRGILPALLLLTFQNSDYHAKDFRHKTGSYPKFWDNWRNFVTYFRFKVTFFFLFRSQSDKNESTKRGKRGQEIYRLAKIAHYNVRMINTDKEQEGIANIIEARKKYRILSTCKRQIAACPEVSEENKQSITGTVEDCNFIKISVRLKVTLDKFYERLAERENIYD